MAYASIAGRARTSSRNPQAHAICDRCGGRFNFVDLHWQYDWRGAVIQNLRILVCRECLDRPQEQLRAIVVPPDPTPIMNARTEPFCIDETNFLEVTAPALIDPVTGIHVPTNNLRTTVNNLNRTINPFGVPEGLTLNAVMPYNGAKQKAFGIPLPLLSVTGNGTTTVTVTCFKPHGLVNNPQIAAEGLAYPDANGFFSVTVISATAFTYMTYGACPLEPLLTPTTLIVTCLISLPCDYDQIPLITGSPGLYLPICFILLQSGGFIVLEDGSGDILLESCNALPFNPLAIIDSTGGIVTDSNGQVVTAS
jgi:hypothetical protein